MDHHIRLTQEESISKEQTLDRLGEILDMINQDNDISDSSLEAVTSPTTTSNDDLNPRPIDCNRMSVLDYVPMEICLKEASKSHSEVLDTSYEILTRMFCEQGEAVTPAAEPATSMPMCGMELVSSLPSSTSHTKRNVEVDRSIDISNKKRRVESGKETTSKMQDGTDSDSDNSGKPHQSEQWFEKYQELCEFQKEHGHCNVPPRYNNDSSLWRWVKRQRYQHKLKRDGKPSTITDERIAALNKIGLVWDSQGTLWMERYTELKKYLSMNGHCNVPSKYSPNPQLSTWVKVRLNNCSDLFTLLTICHTDMRLTLVSSS